MVYFHYRPRSSQRQSVEEIPESDSVYPIIMIIIKQPSTRVRFAIVKSSLLLKAIIIMIIITILIMV